MAGDGRPTKCTDEVIQRLATLRSVGFPKSKCAEYAGIARTTLANWENRGEEGEEPYATFLAEWREAERDCHESLLEEAKEKSPEWLLSRMFPEHYHQARRLQHEGAENMPAIKVEVVGDDDPDDSPSPDSD